MPVLCFVDPAILDDPKLFDVDEITLSYIFYPTYDDESDPELFEPDDDDDDFWEEEDYMESVARPSSENFDININVDRMGEQMPLEGSG